LVKSNRVEPFSTPPFDWISRMNSILPRFFEPWNIMCSKRWAKPVRFLGSMRKPML
jgi:hypothetical protein